MTQSSPRLKLLPAGPFIAIEGDSIFLGRDCPLAATIPALTAKVVSNRHCCIRQETEGRWVLEDLKSTNGTWFKGAWLNEPKVLKPGDVFTLGRSGPRFEFVPPPVDPNKTLSEDDLAGAATMLGSPDGSAEHPLLVGKTPRIVLEREDGREEFTAEGYTVLIGRDPSVQVVIQGDAAKHVSSRHAEIQFRMGGAAFLRDLGSRNGTFLNQRRLTEESPLKVGDRIALGASSLTLVVRALDA